MPTWEGDPRPIEPEPHRYEERDYFERRQEPTLVRQVNTSDALEAIVGIFWSLLVLAWNLLLMIVWVIIWIVRKIRGTSHMARRSSRHRG